MSLFDNSYMGGITTIACIKNAIGIDTPPRKFDGIASEHLTGADKQVHRFLDILESQEVNNAILGTSAVLTAATGSSPAMAGFAGVYLGAEAGGFVGNKLGQMIASYFNFPKIKTEGNIPICANDWVMHQKTSWSVWGLIGGIILGAVAAVATTAFIIGTGGLGAGVLLATVAQCAGGFAGGFVAAVIGAAGAAVGQYGEKKGYVLKESCSPDVFFEGQRVARVGDPISCEDHPWNPPPVIAESVENVFANGRRIARIGHQTQCDGYLDINPENHQNSIRVSEETVTEYQVVPAIGPWARAGVYLFGLIPFGKRKGRQAPKNERPKKPSPREQINNTLIPKLTISAISSLKITNKQTVTYRRVQGGHSLFSQDRIRINENNTIKINNHDSNLSISIDNGEHSEYFLKNKRPGAEIIEFEMPKWFDDFVKENTIPQFNAKSNPKNQNGMAPKITDMSTPGLSIEFPAPWIKWIEEYATNPRIIEYE